MIAECETNAEQRFEIYALIDPRTDEIRYVGKAKDAAKRFKGHMRERFRRDYPVYRWINKLADQGVFPTLKVIETCTDWEEAERRLIAASRERGDRLLNVADGGVQIPNTPEQRTRSGQRLVGWLHDDPRRVKIRKIKMQLAVGLRKGWVSNATRAKMRAAAAEKPEFFASWANIQDRVE